MVTGISIIICCYNSKTRLPVTLQHLFNQQNTQGINWEVIIVDNASTDGTYDFALNLLSRTNISFQVLKEPRPGLAMARLKGLCASKYEYLLYCDDDNHLDTNYIQLAYQLMEQNPSIAILGGIGEAIFENIEPLWFTQYSSSFAVGDQSVSPNDFSKVERVYGAGSIMRKTFLRQLFDSGFKTILMGRIGTTLTSGDDNELCFMTKFFDYEVWYHRGLKFKHLMSAGRMNWAYLKKLYAGFGRMNIYIHAYQYVEQYHTIPDDNLRLPFWLDKYIHRIRYILNYYPRVMWKMNKEGDAEVLRFIAMQAEAKEIWSLKEKYIGVYTSIYKYLNSLRQLNP